MKKKLLTTYAEAKKKQPFDWNAFLNQKDICYMQWEEAQTKAYTWTTCACGNMCVIIPRDERGAPIDLILKDLGGSRGFYGAIMARDKDKAKSFLKKIEKRSALLINKLYKELKEKMAIIEQNK